jgi:hypothetical protein
MSSTQGSVTAGQTPVVSPGQTPVVTAGEPAIVTPVVTPDYSTQKADVFGSTVDKFMESENKLVKMGKGLDERLYAKGITDERTRNYGIENVSETAKNAFGALRSYANFGGKKSKKKSKKNKKTKKKSKKTRAKK